MLPLRRHRFTDLPDAAIGITRDTWKSGKLLPLGWLTPSSRVENYFNELVDIGAGV